MMQPPAIVLAAAGAAVRPIEEEIAAMGGDECNDEARPSRRQNRRTQMAKTTALTLKSLCAELAFIPL
jgi:hypothetical protein